MKVRNHILILFVSILLTGSGAGADSQIFQGRPVRLKYEYSSGEKGLSTFDYNNDGTLDVGVWELLD